MFWVIAKNKPWRDLPTKWRYPSPEFGIYYPTFKEAYKAMSERRDDGAKCKLVITTADGKGN